MASLEIVSNRGESLAYNYDLLVALPDFAQVNDVSKEDARAEGRGVWLSALIPDDEREKASWLTFKSMDHSFSASVPMEAVLNDAIVIYEKGGKPLRPEDGGPFRLLIPESADCGEADVDECANVKNLGIVELSNEKGEDTR